MKRLICLIVAVFWAGVGLSGPKDETLTPKALTEAVESIAELVGENYVFPDVSESVRAELSRRLEKGDYSELTVPAELAARLNEDLMELSDDKHLGVGYDPDWAQEILRQEEEGEEDTYLTEEMIEEERRNNFGFKELRILEGNVGYLNLHIFFDPRFAGETAVVAMGYFSNCDALIVDLRNNGGGWGDMVALLCSYFLSGEEAVLLNTNYYRPDDTYDQSWTLPYVPGKKMPDIPLYVLTSGYTFSAAEEFAYDLKHLERATIVGETTRGGAHPISVRVVLGTFVVYIPDATSINPITGTNWEGVGVSPHIEVPADRALEVAHMDALETLEASAEDESERFLYRWSMEGLEARLHPVIVDSSVLRSYAGTYGSRTIIYEEGTLYCKRGDRPKRRMIPMARDRFMIEALEYVRLKFLANGDAVSGVTLQFNDGTIVQVNREP